MNSLDVEIMWTLKQSPNHHVSNAEITEINPQIIFNETTKERLRYLAERKYVDMQDIQGTGTAYMLTAEGIDFLWEGKLKQRILRMLSIGDYPITNLSRLLEETRIDIKKEINLMQDETPPLVTRYDKERIRYIKITASGQNQIQPNSNQDSSTDVMPHAGQVISDSIINIENITNEMDRLSVEINNEPNLSQVEKEFLTKAVRDTSGKVTQLKEDLAVFSGKFTGNRLKLFLETPSSSE